MALDIRISFSWMNYCRLCLQDKGLKIPIFDKDGLSENIAGKIKECLNIETYDGDPLPRMICHQCLCKLNTAFELHQKAMESFRLLVTHLQILKHVPSVHDYMKHCKLSLGSNETNEDVPVDNNTKSPGGKKSRLFVRPNDPVEDPEEPLETVRVTRSRITAKSSLGPQDGSQKRSVTIVNSLENPSSTTGAEDLPSTSATSDKDSVFLVPLPPKPRAENLFYSNLMDYDGSEELSKRKRKRITDHYDEALMDTGGNLVLAAGRSRESRHRDGKKKKIGPASRTRALATCLSGPSPWQCVLCSCFFSSHNMLRRHLSNCLICQTCEQEFTSAKDKAVHEQDHMLVNLSRYVELLYKCSVCDRAFAAHLMLKQHMKYDHPENSVHSKADPNEPGPCEDPASPEDYADAAEGESCKCDSDDDLKPTQANKSVDRIVEGHEICPKCTRPFVTKQRLSYHLNGHDGLIKCSFCPWMFPIGPGRRRHQRQMHGDKADPVCFTCSLCKETFETKSILYLHKKSHAKSDPPEDASRAEGPSKKTELEHCHVCDKMIQPSKFMGHLLHHANDAYDGKPPSDVTAQEKDPACNLVSATQEQPKVHITQKHFQQKASSSNFVCDGCKQVFANIEAINRHSCPGKEIEQKWKNCEHCGQNLSEEINHVCDNECPVCHKIFKSARGQRLHIQHKHENPEFFSGIADDTNETRSSEGDCGNAGVGDFEDVSVKEETQDDMVEELDTEEQEAERPSAGPEKSRVITAEEPMETHEPSSGTAEEVPMETSRSHAVSDEPCSPTLPADNPPVPVKPDPVHAQSSPITSTNQEVILKQNPAYTKSSPDKSTTMGTPKIRLRPSESLISDPPPLAKLSGGPTNTKGPGFTMKPPTNRPLFLPSVDSCISTPVTYVNKAYNAPIEAERNVAKNVLLKKNNDEAVKTYSLVVSNVTGGTVNSLTNTLTPGCSVGNSGPNHPRTDHSYTAKFSPAPSQSLLSNSPLLANSSQTLVLTPGLGVPISSNAMTPTYVTAVGAAAYLPISNSSQIISNNTMSASNVGNSDIPTITLDAPPPYPSVNINPNSVIRENPVGLPQSQFLREVPPVNPLKQAHNIRCVQISSLQSSPAPTTFTQISTPSNVGLGYGKLFNTNARSSHPTVFNPLQPASGPGDGEENQLRDLLLGRRMRDQDPL